MEWSVLETRQCLELLSWKMDVEWCGFFSENPQSLPPITNGDVAWESFASSLGLVEKLPLVTSQVPSSYGPVKVSGVVLLLGLGSYLCYKLYKVWLYQRFQGAASGKERGNPPPPPTSFADGTPAFSYHHMSESSAQLNDLLNVKTHYFGPLHLNNDDNYTENDISQCQGFSNTMTAAEIQRQPKERRKRYKLISPPSASINSSRRGWLLHKLHFLGPESHTPSGGEEKQSPARLREGYSTGTSSTGSSPIFHPHHHSLSRDLSFDSLSLFGRPRREGSMDSMSSEMSFDMPSFTEQGTESTTVARLDKLQEEIDQLKSNCQMMDEEFETVKCNRNLPGLADLMEVAEHTQGDFTVEDFVRQQSAKACFKGLYSLTTINHSISMELSIDDDSPQISNQFGLSQLPEEEHFPSLEWDEEYSPDQPNNPEYSPDEHTENNCPEGSAATNQASLSILSPPSPNLSTKLDTSGYSSKFDFSDSTAGSQISCLGSPTSPAEDVQEICNFEIVRSMSCESGNGNENGTWSMSESGASDLDSPIVNTAPRPVNIGTRVDILSYAQREWAGNTPKAKTILRGYQEVVERFGYQCLRQIRGDNYCALRSAVFQTLARGLPVPSAAQAMAKLSKVPNIGTQWYQKWKFTNLFYTGTNILRGMEICLQSLDNISTLMGNKQESVKEREETLCNLLNNDRSLDLHIMEAVKLHMMVKALDLHEAYVKGDDVPFFSVLMFARDSSETPLDLMNNHLAHVGDSGGLEQVEMFLLGYTLEVSIRVLRLSSYGTQQFVCFYPDDKVGEWEEISLLAEDDCHYNVVCS